MSSALVLVIRTYQTLVRPFYIQQRCRFYPSCSDYAITAIALHGPVRGTWLAARRLGRCNPFNPGGVDHVPEPSPSRREALSTHRDGAQGGDGAWARSGKV